MARFQKRGEKCGGRTYFRVTHAMYTREKKHSNGREIKKKKKKKEGGGEGRDFTWRNTRLSVRDICFKPVSSKDRYFSCRIRLENIIDFEYLREILSSINPLYSGTRVTHWLCSINFDTLRNVEAEKTFF